MPGVPKAARGGHSGSRQSRSSGRPRGPPRRCGPRAGGNLAEHAAKNSLLSKRVTRLAEVCPSSS